MKELYADSIFSPSGKGLSQFGRALIPGRSSGNWGYLIISLSKPEFDTGANGKFSPYFCTSDLLIYAHINMHDHILIGQLASFNQGKCQVMILIWESDSAARASLSVEIILARPVSITNTIKPNEMKYIREKPNNESKY